MATTDRWVRPLGSQEAMYHSGYQQDCLMCCYVIRLNTGQEVREKDVDRVFKCIIRKAPNLRMYVEEKDGGDFWFREMAEPRIDFEVQRNADPYDEYHKFAHHRYYSSGPFWAVKLLPWSPEQEDFVNKTKMDDPEEPSKLPFVCHILLVSHHSITDGYSSHQIIKLMLSLFDEVLEGKDIESDTEEISVFINRDEEEQFLKEIENEFNNGTRSFNVSHDYYSNLLSNCLLPEGYKVPINNKFETVCLTKNLDKRTTKLFSQRCKKEGITFQSGLTAVLDAAYVKLLQTGGVLRESYTISSFHSINHRTYFKNSSQSLGMCVGMYDWFVDAPQNVLDNFWQYAKHVNQMKIDKKSRIISLERNVIEKLSGASPLGAFDQTKVTKNSLPPMITFGTTNMLDVTEIFGGEKFENIRLDWYDRLSLSYLYPYLWLSVYQTYNGQLMHSLQYNSGFMSDVTAQKLSDIIFRIIKQINA